MAWLHLSPAVTLGKRLETNEGQSGTRIFSAFVALRRGSRGFPGPERSRRPVYCKRRSTGASTSEPISAYIRASIVCTSPYTRCLGFHMTNLAFSTHLERDRNSCGRTGALDVRLRRVARLATCSNNSTRQARLRSRWVTVSCSWRPLKHSLSSPLPLLNVFFYSPRK